MEEDQNRHKACVINKKGRPCGQKTKSYILRKMPLTLMIGHQQTENAKDALPQRPCESIERTDPTRH